MSEQLKYLLAEKDISHVWYNIAADLPEPVPPVLHPGTGKPIGPDDLAPIFPMLTLLTPMRVGRDRSTTVIGYQLTAASIGAVALPGGIGWLVGRSGLEVVAPVLVGAAVPLLSDMPTFSTAGRRSRRRSTSYQ